MFFLITTENKPRFYKEGESVPVNVDDIDFTHEYMENGKLIITSGYVIKDPMQAISCLYLSGIRGYSTKDEAKQMAKKMELRSWKYLNIK